MSTRMTLRDLGFLVTCVQDDDPNGTLPVVGWSAAAKRLEQRGFLISDPSVSSQNVKRYKSTGKGERFVLVFIAMMETL